MGISGGIRTTVRGLIESLGSSATLYSFSSATKTQNEEGDYTVSDWGSGTSIKVISSDNTRFKRLLENMGEESDKSGRTFLIKDTVTVGDRDKIIIGTDAYIVNEIKNIDPIEDTIILKKVILGQDERYTV